MPWNNIGRCSQVRSGIVGLRLTIGFFNPQIRAFCATTSDFMCFLMHVSSWLGMRQLRNNRAQTLLTLLWRQRPLLLQNPHHRPDFPWSSSTGRFYTSEGRSRRTSVHSLQAMQLNNLISTPACDKEHTIYICCLYSVCQRSNHYKAGSMSADAHLGTHLWLRIGVGRLLWEPQKARTLSSKYLLLLLDGAPLDPR